MSPVANPVFLTITWMSWWCAAVGLGSLLVRRSPASVGARGWLGLFVLTAVAMVLALVFPLGDPLARVAAWLVIAVGAVGFLRYGPWRHWRLIAVVAAVAALAALLSSVVPSNYDLGLYHAGSIGYVRDGGTVIGLANLHDRFGFSSSMWPVSAFLGLGLWDGGEFRLFNGVLTVLLVADLVARVRRGALRQPGTVVLALGGLLLLGAVVQYPGRMIASSSQDWAAAVMAVVSTAYLLDVLGGKAHRSAITVTVLTATMAGAMRPTGWIFALATFSVVLIGRVPAEGWRTMLISTLPGVIGVFVLGIATAARDVMTSGWLLFPSGLLPVPVSWRYPDPSDTSEAITAWARTPFQDIAQTMSDSSWIPGWLTRLPTDWAVFAFLVLLAALAVLLIAFPTARSQLFSHKRALALALMPSMVVLIAWLIVAPDPRFAWGPLLLLVLVPVAYSLPAISKPRLLPAALVIGGLGIVVVAVLRGSLLDVSLRLQPMPIAAVTQEELADGTEVMVPIDGDQCWGEFPLCRPWYASDDVELRGQSWMNGFRPRSRLKDNQE